MTVVDNLVIDNDEVRYGENIGCTGIIDTAEVAQNNGHSGGSASATKDIMVV